MTRLILRLYPRAWRERYGQEVLDLVAAEGTRPSDILDLARGAVRARLDVMAESMQRGDAMTGGPAWRHPTAWAIVGLVLLLPTLLFVAGSLAAFQFGAVALQGPMDGIGATVDRFPALLAFLVGAPVLAMALAALPLVHLRRDTAAPGAVAVIGVRLRRVNIAVFAVALAIGAVLAWYVVGEMVLAGGA